MARTPKVVEDRREQIIEAAMRVFSQKGFTRATNKDIAREAGITAGLIYHYFENKEAVLKAIIETRSPLQLVESLPPQLLEQPPAVFLRFLVLQVLGMVERDQFVQLIRVFVPEIIHNPPMSQLGAGVLQRVLAFLSSYFTIQMEVGTLRRTDPSLAAQTLIGCTMGFVLRRQLIHDELALAYSQEQIADAVVDTVLNGLLPRL
ncbi:MAG TPA: TetR/AcrR family transcriptional regulator [Ktedonobacteraceae bacterium]|nr:TetR/AcrR family transcriptional regulator [Ktedonobacteraceae bacterium]